MSTRSRAEKAPSRYGFDRTETLSRAERAALILLVCVLVGIDAVGILTAGGASALHSAVSIVVSLTFLLYMRSPLIATEALGAAIAVSFLAGNAADTLVAGSLAALLVLRLAATPTIIAYMGGLLASSALLASGVGNPDGMPTNVTMYLLVATVAGAVGLALRIAYARGRSLEDQLHEQEEREREAVLAERRAIAGELHDSIAHHLTIVALHSQLLDDDAMREASQDAIRVATRKALSDLRFVIEMAEDTPKDSDAHSNRLAEAIDEALTEIEAAGHSTICDGDPHDERIPRGVEIILTRIIRESATNILKHAGPGEVRIALGVASDSVGLTISSPLPTTPRRDLPSTGTGLNRMAERVLGVRGEFEGGPQGDQWFISVRLPIAPTLASRATPAENELESS